MLKDGKRREFIKQFGVALPMMIGSASLVDRFFDDSVHRTGKVELLSDSPFLTPNEYLKQLTAIPSISRDIYGNGGAVRELEEQFKILTGKEAAIFLPTGTMANQLAIYLLSGDNTKVLVQEDSHVFRDEADAAQSVYGKRLVPIQSGVAGITADDISRKLSELYAGEVFRSGVGAISIESPVRRRDGQLVTYSELVRISEYCKENGFKLHLDGARIQWSEAYEKKTIKDYSELADTIYISLYKCIGSLGGAMLCGPKGLIDKVPHLIKIHGGTIFQNWMYAAIALDNLKTLKEELSLTAQRGSQLVADLVKTGKFKEEQRVNGTNIYRIRPTGNSERLHQNLAKKESIFIRQPASDGTLALNMNKTLLNRTNEELLNSFLNSL